MVSSKRLLLQYIHPIDFDSQGTNKSKVEFPKGSQLSCITYAGIPRLALTHSIATTRCYPNFVRCLHYTLQRNSVLLRSNYAANRTHAPNFVDKTLNLARPIVCSPTKLHRCRLYWSPYGAAHFRTWLHRSVLCWLERIRREIDAIDPFRMKRERTRAECRHSFRLSGSQSHIPSKRQTPNWRLDSRWLVYVCRLQSGIQAENWGSRRSAESISASRVLSKVALLGISHHSTQTGTRYVCFEFNVGLINHLTIFQSIQPRLG
jgi:hypothetical protein